MKKLIAIICLGLFLFGCSFSDIDNTPTKQVETYLNNYQTLDSDVLGKLDSIVNQDTSFTEEQKKTYTDILNKHHQDLVYKIKEETINGDRATVEVEIEVSDYTKALKEANDYRNLNESEFMDSLGAFDEVKFNDYKLKLLKDNKEKVKYTIYFSLRKQDNNWILDDLTQTEQEKILGIYEY